MLVIYLFLLYLVLSTSFNIFLFLHFNGHMASSSRVLSLTFCWYSYLCISPFLYGYVLVFLFSFGTASVLVRLLPGCTNFCHYQCVNWQSTSPFFPKEKNTSTLLLLYMVICKHQYSNGKQSVSATSVPTPLSLSLSTGIMFFFQQHFWFNFISADSVLYEG